MPPERLDLRALAPSYTIRPLRGAFYSHLVSESQTINKRTNNLRDDKIAHPHMMKRWQSADAV